MANLDQTGGSIWMPLLLAFVVAGQLAASQSNVTTTQQTSTTAPSQQGSGSESAMLVSSVNEDELAGEREEPARTTVKKELQPTTEPSAALGSSRPSSSEALQQAMDRTQQSLPQLVQQVGGLGQSMPVSVSAESMKSINEFAARLPDSIESQLNRTAADSRQDSPIDSLLPKEASLFNRDSVEPGQLEQMDCHLRNLDYCLAGLLGGSQKLLPETNDELEVRCDESKATSSCIAVYNKRCATFRALSLLVPFVQASGGGGGGGDASDQDSPLANEQRRLLGQLGRETKLSAEMEAQLLNKNVSSLAPQRLSLANLMDLCEPGAKGTPVNRELRQRLFSLARCINARVPKINPCFNDLKAALQVFYEPRRVLPLQPTCCAIARFRACSSEALDRVCGLSSFEQLIASMGGSSRGPSAAGPLAMLRALDRVCRQAADHKSSYCSEVLPPSGMRAPQRRAHKASKLAKALDLFSFAPAIQDASAL